VLEWVQRDAPELVGSHVTLPICRHCVCHLVRDEETKPAPKAASPFRRPSAGQAEKTLTCADCGTMKSQRKRRCGRRGGAAGATRGR
jgi:hypothetical protein